MPSFSIPLSGLKASQQALSVVANNLSNINTVGYKDEQTNFKDLFYQTLGTNGAGDALEIGAGSAVGSVSGNFTPGNVQSTGIPTDVAINGNGFLVTKLNGETTYTRAGNLTVSSDGFLTTQDGQYVMGYPAANGVISTGTLSNLQVGTGTVIPASATTSFQMNTNLNANAAVGSEYSTPPMTVYDSLGTAHELTFNFTKTAANSWSYNVTIPDTDLSVDPTTGNPIVPTTPPTQITVASGTMGFDSNGVLSTVNGTAVNNGGSTSPNITTINLSNLTDGASPMTMNWAALSASSSSLITQTSSDSATSASSQNGFSSGSLNSFAITPNGTIEGAYSNGQSLAIGQIILAQFGNENGLSRVGGNSFQSTVASGQAVIGIPGTGGLGTVTGGALEQSNVDMATEFSQMIVDQRGFEANAKVITAFDQVTQDTINIEH